MDTEEVKPEKKEHTEQFDAVGAKSKKRKKIIIIILIICALIAGGIVAYCLLSNPYDTNASSISMADRSDEEIQKELDEKTEASRLWISVATTCRIESGSNVISAKNSKDETISVLNNLSDNTRDIKYTLTLPDGTVIYESELLKPGQSITTPEVKNKPDAGTYELTVTAQGYDQDSHKKLGGPLSAQVQLVVQ